MGWCAAGMLCGCTFGDGGVGGTLGTLGAAGSTGEATPADSTTEGGPGGDTGPGSSSGSGNSDPADETADETADDDAATTTGIPQGSTGAPQTAKLTFGGQTSFGPTPYLVAVTELLTLTNEGMVAATQIGQPELPANFSYSGGVFPGEGGTCTTQLEVDASCQIELTFSAEIVGVQTFELEVEYDNGRSVFAATATVDALVEGSTSNLLLNPSFEDEPSKPNPMPSWTIESGVWEVDFDPGDSPSGDRHVFAGEGAREAASENLAWQDIEIAGWTESVDAGEIEVAIAGQAGTWDGDTGWMRLVSVDEEGDPQLLLDPQIGPDTNWMGWMPIPAASTTLPAGARTLRVELLCSKPDGNYCNAYFDGLSLIATYGG